MKYEGIDTMQFSEHIKQFVGMPCNIIAPKNNCTNILTADGYYDSSIFKVPASMCCVDIKDMMHLDFSTGKGLAKIIDVQNDFVTVEFKARKHERKVVIPLSSLIIYT